MRIILEENLKMLIMSPSLQHHILQEVENLIDTNCTYTTLDQAKDSKLHQAIIKKYFKADTVEFDFASNIIKLQVQVDKGRQANVEIDVDFEKLPDFLKTCLEKDQSSLRYYKSLLNYYHTREPLSA